MSTPRVQRTVPRAEQEQLFNPQQCVCKPQSIPLALGVPVYIAIMYGLIAGLFAAGVCYTLGPKTQRH